MDTRKPKKASLKVDKDPYDRRGEKITSKAFKSVEQSVKPVAKDTNRTRRKTTRARKVGETVPTEKPVPSMRKAMKGKAY